MIVRRANSAQKLLRLLDSVRAGREEKPDWIQLQAGCRLDEMPRAERVALLGRLHTAVRRGFRAGPPRVSPGPERLDFWRSVASSGFHDFSELGWMKCYDSAFVRNYDYVGAYQQGGLAALDPYMVYSAVLGTHDYSAEDLLETRMCAGVRTVVEPMAGSAEFTYYSHFRHPDFRYLMIDLDGAARSHVQALPWLEETERHYILADVLEDSVWKQAKSLASGRSLALIGKQSHQVFGARDLHRLMKMATDHVDFLVLEVLEPGVVSDFASEEDLTRPEMEDAGFRVVMRDEPWSVPNPLTSQLSFRIDVSDASGCRTLFRYPDWTSWSPCTLVAFARLLDLEVYYFHSKRKEFVSVEEGTQDSDCTENVTFMLFTRHADGVAD
jgi:hypothetical protein